MNSYIIDITVINHSVPSYILIFAKVSNLEFLLIIINTFAQINENLIDEAMLGIPWM